MLHISLGVGNYFNARAWIIINSIPYSRYAAQCLNWTPKVTPSISLQGIGVQIAER